MNYVWLLIGVNTCILALMLSEIYNIKMREFYTPPNVDYDGLVIEMNKHEAKIDKVEAGVQHIFGTSYLDDEFPSTHDQGVALIFVVAYVFQGLSDSLIGSVKQ